MGQFFSLKNSKFFSGLKKLAHSDIHYYSEFCIVLLLLGFLFVVVVFLLRSHDPVPQIMSGLMYSRAVLNSALFSFTLQQFMLRIFRNLVSLEGHMDIRSSLC